MGQVCSHRKYHYTCVIYGWDAVCTASSAWIAQMGVDKLEQQDKQPFYNVLVGDGSQRWRPSLSAPGPQVRRSGEPLAAGEAVRRAARRRGPLLHRLQSRRRIPSQRRAGRRLS